MFQLVPGELDVVAGTLAGVANCRPESCASNSAIWKVFAFSVSGEGGIWYPLEVEVASGTL